MKSRNVSLCVRLEDDYKSRLVSLADERNVSMAQLIRNWIDKEAK